MKTAKKILKKEDINYDLTTILKRLPSLKEAYSMNDKEMEAIYSVAYHLFSAAKYEEAQTLFSFLSLWDPSQHKYWVGLGAVRQCLKNYEEAIDAYGMAAILDTHNPTPAAYAADCHMALGNTQEAINALDTAIEWSGDNYKEIKEKAENLKKLLQEKK